MPLKLRKKLLELDENLLHQKTKDEIESGCDFDALYRRLLEGYVRDDLPSYDTDTFRLI